VIRKAFKMQLRPGMAEEYRRRHDSLWPEMRDMIRAHGGRNYSIFLDSDTDTLVGYIEIENEDLWAASANTDVCRRWWDYMSPLMAVNPDNSPVTHTLESVFHLD
jgi:L-rhamnose mutarotase